MGLFSKKRDAPVVVTHPDESVSLRELVAKLQALELAHDDLHDQFRRFRGRITKRMSLDFPETATEAPPNGRPPTMHELKASGRWPLR